MDAAQQKSLVTRFAPSPTGYLHLGHVVSIAYVFGIADKLGAKVLLRMEDHDRERCRKEYEQAIIDDMAWLGFIPHNWQEFTQRKTTKYRQSDQPEVYQKVLDKLMSVDKIYPCTCSRRQLEEEGIENAYPGTCRRKRSVEGEHGLRFIVEDRVETFFDIQHGHVEQKPAEQCGDFLVKDRRGCFTYNFSVVVDDLEQGVNLVIRGEDLLHCTGRQMALARALGGENSPLYFHHPLATGNDGKKLSKRILSEGIIVRRQRGDSPKDVIREAMLAAGVLS